MRLALLGDPVAHSLSPAIHRAALAACGLEGTYEARRVDAAGVRLAFDEIRYGSLHGANVTMPHKHLAFSVAESLSQDALRTGAVNTLQRWEGAVRGSNTDVAGILDAWSGAGLPDAPALILGAGGAAAAALVALGGRTLHISARRSDTAEALVARTRSEAEIVAWGRAVPGAVVVNATALGMEGEQLPPGVVAAATGLLEMPYASGPTPAEREAARLGLPVANGIDMLVGQAAASFTLWTGLAAPRGVMTEAAEGARRSQAPR